ncbi:MAG: hypothetical protein NTY53_16990, partial [Kiritimatiellaeota bacterium]|nr:hypothetical protein [Kiritimatiellota bacterium]
MKNEAKRCRWSGWSARLCGLALLVALCAPVRVVGDEQLDQQLANERQALQGLLNNPNTNAETKALVREMLDWNARGRSVAEFQQTHTQPAAAHHTAASAAGDAIFGGGLRQAGVPAMQPVTGGHIPAPAVTRRIAVAGEEGGLSAASPAPMVIKRITDTLSDGLINRATAVTAASQVRGKTENFHADTVEILRESKSAQSGVGDVLIKGKSTSDTLAKGALLQSEISRFKETARSGAEAAPAKKTAVAAWGDPDTFSLQRLQPRGEMVVGKQLSESAQNAVGVKKEQTVGVWAEPNMAHTNQLIARKKVYTGPLNEAGGKGAAYTQSNVIGGKGEAYQQQMQAATQRLREESVNRASQTPLTPMRTLNTGPAANNNDSIKRSLNSDFGHAIGAPLAPVSDSGRKAKVNEAWNGIAGTTAAP